MKGGDVTYKDLTNQKFGKLTVVKYVYTDRHNCHWTTAKQQNRNTRNNKYIIINGETHCLAEWCEILNLNYETVKSRLRYGWSIEKALELKGRRI